LQVWSWIQIVFLLLSISYLFGNIALINEMDDSFIYLYGAFVFLSVYALTELMDRNRYAIFWEALKNISALAIIFYYGDWFGASQYISWINYFLIAYFITATMICAWFVFLHLKEDRQLKVSF
jgi:alkylglycerol monooxygenase